MQLAIPGLAGLSTALALGSCGNPTQSTSVGTAVKNASVGGGSGISINTKVLRMGYQQAGDLVRVSGVLEKRLAPLGVKVEWLQFAQGPQLMEGMNVGRIDLGSAGDTPPVYAQAAGAKIVYAIGRRRASGKGSAIVVPLSSPIQKLKDIKGQKVFVQKGSAPHYFLLRALEEVGLKQKDVQLVSMPVSDTRDAFIQGHVPVWVGYGASLALAKKQVGARVLRTAEGIDSPGGYYLAARQFATENPELLRIVFEEIQTIGKWADEHPKETADLLIPETKLDLDLQETVIRLVSISAN